MGCKYSDYMGYGTGVLSMRRFALFVCACAIAAAGAGFSVSAASPPPVETVSEGTYLDDDFPAPSVSGGDVSVGDIMPFASYDVYYGSISSTYLEYMRGYLSKLPPDCHYVGARVSRYDYLFAYGDELVYDGRYFSGPATVVRWNTENNGSFSFGSDNSFSLDAGPYLVYTDLTDKYPALATSSDFTLRQILILFTVFCIAVTCHTMYQVRKIRRIRKEENQ